MTLRVGEAQVIWDILPIRRFANSQVSGILQRLGGELAGRKLEIGRELAQSSMSLTLIDSTPGT
jgi:hypothetical protein